MQAINLNLNGFSYQCKKNINFLSRFREQIVKMEDGYSGEWSSNKSLNNFFFEYEKQIQTDYLISTKDKNFSTYQDRDPNTFNNTTIVDSIKMAYEPEYGTKLLFENKENAHLKEELINLPQRMDNPFTALKRYIKWEIMDLEAMIESIETKSDMAKCKNSMGVSLTKHQMSILKMQKGNYSMKNTFKSKNGKVNAITNL